LRLLAVPIFAWLHVVGRPGPALAVFVAASLSDSLDGALARLLDQKSDLGGLLDPIADKLLVTTALVLLAFTASVPGWFLVLIVIRESMLLVGAIAVRRRGWHVPRAPARLGKYAAFLEFGTAVLGLADQVPGWSGLVHDWLRVTVFLGAECVVGSACQYAYRFAGMLVTRPKQGSA
jgi:cardiolipin synthase